QVMSVSCRVLCDGTCGAHFEAVQAAGAARSQQQRALWPRRQRARRAGDDTQPAGRAAPADGDPSDGHRARHWRYPRGVTMRPETILVVEDPTITQVVMPTVSLSNVDSVDTVMCCAALVASV